MSALLLLDPSVDAVLFLFYAAPLDLDLGAGLALFVLSMGVHWQFHAARLAGSVFLGTMLAEVSPLVIAADHLILVVETHFGWKLWMMTSVSLAADTRLHLKHDLAVGVQLTGY